MSTGCHGLGKENMSGWYKSRRPRLIRVENAAGPNTQTGRMLWILIESFQKKKDVEVEQWKEEKHV
jgi:hypothetical protein